MESTIVPCRRRSLVKHRSFSIITVHRSSSFIAYTNVPSSHASQDHQQPNAPFQVCHSYLVRMYPPQSTHSCKCRSHRRAPRAFSTPTLACAIVVSTRTTPLPCRLPFWLSLPPLVLTRCGYCRTRSPLSSNRCSPTSGRSHSSNRIAPIVMSLVTRRRRGMLSTVFLPPSLPPRRS